MKICLDAGHYGKYNQSPANMAYYESDIVWKLHLFLKEYLQEYGIEVITTRESQKYDLALYERGRKSFGCDLFISLHSNAVGNAVNQTIDYPVAYCAVNGKADKIGMALAGCVERTMQTNQKARIEHRSGKNGDYYGVLRGATAAGTPGLILEHSFHTHPQVVEWLLNEENLKQMAMVEAATIAEFYGMESKVIQGWNKGADGRYRYVKADGNIAGNEWVLINHHWYLFNKDGYMLTGWQQWDSEAKAVGQGEWYFLDNTPGGELEGACWHESADRKGAQEIWYIE